MKRLSKKEIDGILRKYLNLKEKAESGLTEDVKEFNKFQSFCIETFKHLIEYRAARYTRFINYIDLKQDGFEALMLAFNSFNPDKGNFLWWAGKYIGTKISRAANAHSTIKIPMNKIKDFKPFKVDTFPEKISYNGPFEIIELKEKINNINCLINKLPSQHKNIINMTYGCNGFVKKTKRDVAKSMNLSRKQYLELLAEAEEQIRQEVINLEQDYE